MIKAIFCDLDGTLLRKDMTLSEENSRAIERLADSGILFIPTSGRNLFEMPSEVRSHRAISRFLASNGAGYYNLKSGESRHRSISQDSAVKMLDAFSKMSVVPVIHSIDGRGYFARRNLDVALMRDHRMSEYYCRYFYENAFPVDDLYGHFSDGVGVNSVCVFFKYEQELRESEELLRSLGVGYTNSTEGELEIFNPAAGKGNALVDFAASHGIGIEETMAIGDSMNDFSMLSVTPNSVAVSGANPRLLEAVKHVGCSNEEHIMDYVIKNLL